MVPVDMCLVRSAAAEVDFRIPLHWMRLNLLLQCLPSFELRNLSRPLIRP